MKRKIPSNKVILSSDLKDVRKQVMQLFGERAPEEEGVGNVKILKWEHRVFMSWQELSEQAGEWWG